MVALANAGERDMSRQGEGVYVGEDLPPVLTKLAKRIRSGEYVEMEELLPEVCTRDDGEPEAKRRNSRHVLTYLPGFSTSEYM